MSTPLLNVFTLLALLLCLSQYSLHRSFAADSPLNSECSKSSYASNSTYEKNLSTLFHLLKTNATRNNAFYNTSVAGDDDGTGTVYGLFLCRGDDSHGDCRRCVANATAQISKDCPTTRPVMATIWYTDCMVRYSNQSMYGVEDTSTKKSMISHNTISSNQSGFMELVGKTVTELVILAANSPKRYKIKEATFTSFIMVYAEAQCTPDLSVHECEDCLTIAKNQFPVCCYNSTGARVLTPSCYVRYDIHPFYTTAPLPQPVPQLPISSPPPTNINIPSTGKRKASTFAKIVIVILVAILVVLVSICVYVVWRRGKNRSNNAEGRSQTLNPVLIDPPNLDYVTDDISNAESLRYDWEVLQTATNNFSEENKLGEGGFGIVYKGILANGQEIAVKRLSKGSNQGAEQLKNEVVFVAKLQHRNLVKLLGYCLAAYEKLLVYEFIPNKSLDLFLFDPVRRTQLDLPMRYNIIQGIARGMLYLHEDSRLRIIHRDLKASNILLDANMNPKISDFGTARNFKLEESLGNTNKIAGTLGYIAPEYLLHGEFSVKSDVYSFGVLLLEIVSGQKSTSFRHSKATEHISTYVWNQWKGGSPLEVIDLCLEDSYSNDEVKRCIQIGLLCVQGDAEKRPTMGSVVFNLNSNSTLPAPEEPAFLTSSGPTKELELAKSSSNSIQLSFNADASIG